MAVIRRSSPTVPGNPEGLAFAANFDLYVSTSESTGHVYRLHFQPSFPCRQRQSRLWATQVTEQYAVAFSFVRLWSGYRFRRKWKSSGGEEHLPVAASLMRLRPIIRRGGASSLVSGLSKPIGVAVNTCGEILVAVGRKIDRRNKKTGALLGNYVTFGGGKVVRYIGVTSTNEVFAVVTNNSGSNGQVYRVAGALQSPGTDIFSCTDGTATALGASLDNLVGLAVPASNAFITKSFGAKGADNACGDADDVLTPSSRDFQLWSSLLHAEF